MARLGVALCFLRLFDRVVAIPLPIQAPGSPRLRQRTARTRPRVKSIAWLDRRNVGCRHKSRSKLPVLPRHHPRQHTEALPFVPGRFPPLKKA